jgi:acyl-coenzyme A thioesterase PaaI-like protein
MRPTTFRRLMNLWPPFLFNSIAVTHISDDWSEVRVRLRLRFWNQNFVRTQFGGNLFAMADPFFMLMGIHRLGDDYFVWDKAGEIEFVAPGKEHVYAHFVMSDQAVEELRAEAAGGAKVLRWFEVDITTAQGDLVAKVRKQIYVRQKPRVRAT